MRAAAARVRASAHAASQSGEIARKRQSLSSSSSAKDEGCNCKKNKCQTLHCACLKRGVVCAPSCRCINCLNTPSLKKSVEAVEPSGIPAHRATAKQIRGCRCPRSQCLQKHCGCYKAGLPCGKHCRCVDCKNNNSRGHTVKERNARAKVAAAEFGQAIAGTSIDLEDEDEEEEAEEALAAGVLVAFSVGAAQGGDKGDGGDPPVYAI